MFLKHQKARYGPRLTVTEADAVNPSKIALTVAFSARNPFTHGDGGYKRLFASPPSTGATAGFEDVNDVQYVTST